MLSMSVFNVALKMVLNIKSYQGTVLKLEIPLSRQH